MTTEQLNDAKNTIGELAGWGKRYGVNYTAYNLFRDMTALHPGIAKSVYQVRRALAGAIRVPPAWDKVVLELIERATRPRVTPPTRGPF